MCVFSWYEKRNDKFLVHYTGPVVFMAIRARRTKTSIVNERRLDMVSEGGDNCLPESQTIQTIQQMLGLSLSNAQLHSPISRPELEQCSAALSHF